MAEVAALGLAANILQMLDFSQKFVRLTLSIYDAGVEGVNFVDDLYASLPRIKSTLQDLRSGNTNEIDDPGGIDALADRCTHLVQEILDSLPKINRKRMDWVLAIRSGLKLAWKKNDIKALHGRLNCLRDDLTACIVISLRSSVRASLARQDQILKELDTIKRNSRENPKPGEEYAQPYGLIVGNFLTKQLEDPKEETERILQALEQDIFENEQGSDIPGNRIYVPRPRKKLLHQIFIDQLAYTDMESREHQIPPAHESTFSWVFQKKDTHTQSWNNLKHWLQSDRKIYWITGKAGSGKSTLMRYISQIPHGNVDSRPRCEKFLLKWGDTQKPLTIVNFYFWASGSKMQKSQLGLFRSLLHQLLQCLPNTIPTISPKRWEALSLLGSDSREITTEEAYEMFYSTIEIISQTNRIVLFIDGLDEFDGDPRTLITLFKSLSSRFPIKLCVSSRPWIEFEAAFRKMASLKVEDLTASDIKKYVAARFGENDEFSILQEKYDELADDLLESIVQKASGVFLWVKLTVTSLLSGLVHGDRIEDLQTRLNLLPADLESLYDRIIGQIDPLYQEHAAQYFEIITKCKRSPPLLLFCFADQSKFIDFALRPDTLYFHKKRLSLELDAMDRRLNSRCKGLLEVSYVSSDNRRSVVQYLHRTVADYLKGRQVQERLRGFLKTPYDANVRLLAASIAVKKLMDYEQRQHSCVLESMEYASNASSGHRRDVLVLLDELRRVTRDEYDKLHRLIPMRSLNVLLDGVSIEPHDAFLCVAVYTGNIEYVKARAPQGCTIYTPYTQRIVFGKLLGYFMLKRESKHLSLLFFLNASDSHSPDMLRACLSRGADIDRQYCKFGSSRRRSAFYNVHGARGSVWMDILGKTMLGFSEEGTAGDYERRHLAKYIRIMIDNGAEVSKRNIRGGFEWICATTAAAKSKDFGCSKSVEKEILSALKSMKRDPKAKFNLDVPYSLMHSPLDS